MGSGFARTLEERVFGPRVEPDWVYLAENPDGLPLRDGRSTVDVRDHDALRSRARDMMAAIFAPLSDALHRAIEDRLVRARASVGHDEPDVDDVSRLPLAGSETERSPYGSPLVRWLRQRPDIAAKPWLLTYASERCGSEQTLEGHPHQEGIDVVAPIGAYGPRLAFALVDAARAMGSVAREVLADASADATRRYAPLLSTWTFQTSVMASMLAGISTYAGVAAVLTFHRLPDTTALEALELVEEGRLFDRLAKIPFAILGPMFFYGIVPRRTLAPPVPTSASARAPTRPALAAPFERLLRNPRFVDSPWIVGPGQGRATHKGCPIALRNLPGIEGARARAAHAETFVATLGRDYLRLARAYYRTGT